MIISLNTSIFKLIVKSYVSFEKRDGKDYLDIFSFLTVYF